MTPGSPAPGTVTQGPRSTRKHKLMRLARIERDIVDGIDDVKLFHQEHRRAVANLARLRREYATLKAKLAAEDERAKR